jgi:Golgi apparatus protein 1
VADNQIDSGDLMECLIQNKHQKDMNEKCAIGVTHFQLVSALPVLSAVLTVG